jgi:hypothetical protein
MNASAVTEERRNKLFHYTNRAGYNAIRSQPTWLFKAFEPPGGHPKGAYFTTLPPGTVNLGKRIFVRGCRDKLEFAFHFSGSDGLQRIAGGRGEVIFCSPDDYPVEPSRQLDHGLTQELQGRFA